MKKSFSLLLLIILAWTNIYAQVLKAKETSYVNINELPEFVVITSENTKILGGININIAH